jgi:hypothetical protein
MTDTLDIGLRKIIEIAKREGIIPMDQVSDVEVVRLSENGELDSVILTLNPEIAIG